jgi:hypothetical protein
VISRVLFMALHCFVQTLDISFGRACCRCDGKCWRSSRGVFVNCPSVPVMTATTSAVLRVSFFARAATCMFQFCLLMTGKYGSPLRFFCANPRKSRLYCTEGARADAGCTTQTIDAKTRDEGTGTASKWRWNAAGRAVRPLQTGDGRSCHAD